MSVIFRATGVLGLASGENQIAGWYLPGTDTVQLVCGLSELVAGSMEYKGETSAPATNNASYPWEYAVWACAGTAVTAAAFLAAQSNPNNVRRPRGIYDELGGPFMINGAWSPNPRIDANVSGASGGSQRNVEVIERKVTVVVDQ